MNILMMALMTGLIGCNEYEKREDVKSYIVAGQSNAFGCDWSYFEDKTESNVIMLAVNNYSISALIEILPIQLSVIEGVDIEAVLFVHGESDAVYKTENYTEQVEDYRIMLGNHTLYISTVGHYTHHLNGKYPDILFDTIIEAVKLEAETNDNWVIAFDEARNFSDWGMLKYDEVHFNSEGCEMMMDAFANELSK